MAEHLRTPRRDFGARFLDLLRATPQAADLQEEGECPEISRQSAILHALATRHGGKGGLTRRALAWTAALLLACASAGALPPPDLAPVWREFLALPEQRALAIAGDPRRDRWVAGASGGHATSEEAEAAALRECRIRRGRRRLQAACVLYAVGDEIVWRGR